MKFSSYIMDKLTSFLYYSLQGQAILPYTKMGALLKNRTYYGSNFTGIQLTTMLDLNSVYNAPGVQAPLQFCGAQN